MRERTTPISSNVKLSFRYGNNYEKYCKNSKLHFFLMTTYCQQLVDFVKCERTAQPNPFFKIIPISRISLRRKAIVNKMRCKAGMQWKICRARNSFHKDEMGREIAFLSQSLFLHLLPERKDTSSPSIPPPLFYFLVVKHRVVLSLLCRCAPFN